MRIKSKIKILLILFMLIAAVQELRSDYKADLKTAFGMMKDGDYSSAENMINSLISSNPSEYRAYMAMSVLKIKTDDLASAEEFISKAKSLNSTDSKIIYIRAIIEEKSGNKSKAVELYKQFLKAEPESSKRERIEDKLRLLK